MSAETLQPGDPVRAGRDASFTGHLLGTGSSINQYTYYRDGVDWNIPVWGVENRDTGEVRLFRQDAITFAG